MERVGDTIEQMKVKRDIFLENQSKYFEIAGYRLERENHGAPECHDIALNEQKASWTKPQAWSHEIDGKIYWYYNYPGAWEEANHLGKTIPTIEQWLEILASIPGSVEKKAQALNTTLIGWRSIDTGRFCNIGDYAHLWSSSPFGSEGIYYPAFERDNSNIKVEWSDRRYGMSLRFLSDII